MKRCLIGLLAAFICCGCSTYKLANTVWYNVTPGELNGEAGNIVTSLYFFEGNQMCTNVSVEQNDKMLVPPTATAFGEYTSKGRLPKGVSLVITETDATGEAKTRCGLITAEGLLLYETDSLVRVYSKASNLTLKKER